MSASKHDVDPDALKVAKYIKPEQASQEWGATDALNMTLIIVTMALGSYIVTNFSYDPICLLFDQITKFRPTSSWCKRLEVLIAHVALESIAQPGIITQYCHHCLK